MTQATTTLTRPEPQEVSPHNASEKPYVIPAVEMPSLNYLLILIPVCALAGWIITGNSHGTVLMGAAIGVPVAVLIISLRVRDVTKRQREIWAKHNYAWYRSTFPACAHANGRVSCRHCGSHKTNVRNLMNRTFMRLHSCSQCGETLYFSPEKV
jgi:hypothetical protein